MELSGNAKRAMDQVERNLSVLYGADYFTEDEWIKLDGLLHKGRYVLSAGPPTNEVDEEPLMTFDDSRDDIKHDGPEAGHAQNIVPEVKGEATNTMLVKEEVTETVAEIADDQSFCQTRSDPLMDSDDESVSSPVSQHDNSLPSPVENTYQTPADTSDEDSFPQSKAAEPTPDSQVTGSTEATTVPSPEVQPQEETEAPKPEIKAPQAPRYTQEQLDEVRAFNAGLTKAGQKGRPKYEKNKDDYSEWDQNYDEPPMDEQAYPSPPPTEREARVDTWADGVAKLPPSHPSSHIESPTPSRPNIAAPAVEILAERFIKAHGRMPKSLNDFYQPNNPEHRPGSQASSKTTKTSTTLTSATIPALQGLPPANGIVLGKVYVAQSAAPQRGIRIAVRAGDPIKVIKFVSGIMYIGENLRSKENGQIPETIFRRDAASSHTTVNGRRGLDQVENANAAEWDDVASVARSTVAARTSASNLGGGLAASRFSTTQERAPAKRSAQAQPGDIAADMAGQIGKIINDKFEEMLMTRMGSSAPQAPQKPTPQRSAPTPAPKPAQKGPFYVEPKTETCWFWSVKNDCRFTAEECRDLHAFIPNRTGTPKNLYKGKPTWGALADYPDYVPPASDAEAAIALGGVDEELKSTGKSCYYWAVLGNCEYSAEKCRYLHEHSRHGIAAKPGRLKPSWRREWRGSVNQDAAETESGVNDNDFVLEEFVEEEEEELDAWGEPIKRTKNAYKPPHVRMEEQAAQSASGW